MRHIPLVALAACLASAGSAHAQDDDVYLKGVSSTRVEVGMAGNVREFIDSDVAQAVAEAKLKRAGLQTGNSENLLWLEFHGFKSRNGRQFYYAVGANFLRLAQIMTKPKDPKNKFSPVPMVLWDKAVYGTVGVNRASTAIMEELTGLIEQFTGTHRRVNAGYSGPPVSGFPPGDYAKDALRGIDRLSVVTSFHSSLSASYNDGWVERMAKDRLPAAGVNVAQPSETLETIGVNVDMMNLDWTSSLFITSFKVYRRGIVRHAEGATLMRGWVWGRRNIHLEGISPSIIGRFIVEEMNRLAASLKARQ